jgi:hypothetical protein
MFRTYKPQSPRRVSHKKHLPDEQTTMPPSTTQVHPMLQMQSLIGNHATQRMIQRMPTQQAIINTLGKPKKNIGLIKNSTKYKLVLDRVHAYDTLIMQTTLGDTKNEIQAQMVQVQTLLNAIFTAVSAYDEDDGKKAAYMKNLKPQVRRELSAASAVVTKYLTAPIPQMRPKLFIALSSPTVAPMKLDERNIVGNDRGGTSEVTRFNQGGREGFFKQNKETLSNWNSSEEERALKDQATQGKSKDESFAIRNGMNNEKAMGIGKVGIDPNDAHMANRDVAMYRLDQLLEGGVIAKAEIATRETPNGTVYGSFMEKAKDESGAKLIEEGRMTENSTEQAQVGNKAINRQDPTLMRLLSRLQMIDLLCFQIDRKPDNYFIQFDNNGKVTGITGIDNDFALGTNTDLSKRYQELPGISRYVDEELALKILNIDLDLVRLVMVDLLSSAEIDALITRFDKMRQFLQPLKENGQLLKPDQWDDGVAKGLLEERKNYYQDISFFKGKLGPKPKKT